MFCRSLFVLFLLAIVLSVFLRFTNSDYLPFVKLLLHKKNFFRGKINTDKTHIHGRLISNLGTGTLIKCGVIKRNDNYSCEAIRNLHIK